MSDRDDIEAAIDHFIAAYNSGDLSGVLDTYDNGLIKLRQGATPETKAEIARRLAQVFEKFRTHVEVMNQEIEVGGDLAYARGRFRVTLTPHGRGGGSGAGNGGDRSDRQVFQRRFLEIWRRRGGRWRVVRTMDNSGEDDEHVS
jgi:ketosteroid isomerase-like protein